VLSLYRELIRSTVMFGPVTVANANRIERFRSVEIMNDLLGDWVVTGTGPNKRHARFVAACEADAVAVAERMRDRQAPDMTTIAREPAASTTKPCPDKQANIARNTERALRTAADEVGSRLFELCKARMERGEQYKEQDKETPDLFDADGRMDGFVDALVALLVSGDALGQARLRCILAQSLRMTSHTMRERLYAEASSGTRALAPRALHPFLDRTVTGFLTSKNGATIAEVLSQAQIHRVGDLVERSHGEIEGLLGGARAAEVLDELRAVGLSFGLSAPLWNAPGERRSNVGLPVV